MDGISPTVQAMLDRTARDWGLQPCGPAMAATARVALPVPRATQHATPSTTRALALACD